jgi:DNA-directed RNA polymerase specialized sigma24 family protein
LDSFCRHAAHGRFPQLEDRDDLWKLLFTITKRKAAMQVKHELRRKRGGGRVHGGSEVLSSLNNTAAPEPTPESALQLVEEMRRLLDELQDETLTRVAIMKMAVHTNAEIAAENRVSVRTIIRKLEVIRSIWSNEE